VLITDSENCKSISNGNGKATMNLEVFKVVRAVPNVKT
jgi:hypothetical protein